MTRKEIDDQRGELVVKSNELLRQSRYSLDAVEQKIIVYLISKIRPDDTELDNVRIKLSELFSLMGIQDGGESYVRLKRIIKGIRDKSWWITSGEKDILFSWIDAAEIEHGVVTLRLSDSLKPHLLALRERFTQYEMVNILVLRSRYAIRLYELFMSYRYQGEWVVSVAELRDILQTGDKYKDYRDFRKRVLTPSLKEINKYTDLTVEMETIRMGRRIESLRFTIKKVEGLQMVWDVVLNQRERLGDEC